MTQTNNSNTNSAYKIMRNGKRFNTKAYSSYEEARNRARAWAKETTGSRAISDAGLSIQRITTAGNA